MIEDTSDQYNLGTVDSFGGKLIFQLIVERDGSTYLNVLAFNPDDPSDLAVMSALDASGYQKLKQIIEDTDNLFDKLKSSNAALQWRWPFQEGGFDDGMALQKELQSSTGRSSELFPAWHQHFRRGWPISVLCRLARCGRYDSHSWHRRLL